MAMRSAFDSNVRHLHLDLAKSTQYTILGMGMGMVSCFPRLEHLAVVNVMPDLACDRVLKLILMGCRSRRLRSLSIKAINPGLSLPPMEVPACLARLTSLERLSLFLIRPPTETLRELRGLRHLCIERCKLIGATLNAALRELTGLQHLVLSRNEFETESVDAIVPALRELTGLRHLDLSKNHMNHSGADALAQALRELTGLQHLDLGYNMLGSNGAGALAQSLRELTGLQHLDLSVNILNNCFVTLAPALHKLTGLQVLRIGGNGFMDDHADMAALVPALLKLTGLKHLCMSSNELSVSAAKKLAPVMQRLSCLRYLDLSDNDLCSNGVAIIIHAIRGSNLERLLIYDNSMSDDEADVLSVVTKLFLPNIDLNIV